MARKSGTPVPARPGLGQIAGGNLRIGGAVVVFASHDEAAGDLGAKGGSAPQKGQGRVRRALLLAPRWMTCNMFMAALYKYACRCQQAKL
jgi:hypothetical protein